MPTFVRKELRFVEKKKQQKKLIYIVEGEVLKASNLID